MANENPGARGWRARSPASAARSREIMAGPQKGLRSPARPRISKCLTLTN
jgi:hypothetical protein